MKSWHTKVQASHLKKKKSVPALLQRESALAHAKPITQTSHLLFACGRGGLNTIPITISLSSPSNPSLHIFSGSSLRAEALHGLQQCPARQLHLPKQSKPSHETRSSRVSEVPNFTSMKFTEAATAASPLPLPGNGQEARQAQRAVVSKMEQQTNPAKQIYLTVTVC